MLLLSRVYETLLLIKGFKNYNVIISFFQKSWQRVKRTLERKSLWKTTLATKMLRTRLMSSIPMRRQYLYVSFYGGH